MNKRFLRKYITNAEAENLLNQLRDKQRTNILTKKYFIKIGKNTSALFYGNLVREINLYKANRGNSIFPNIRDEFIDGETCILVLDRIEGNPLGKERNEFNLDIEDEDRIRILTQIQNIQNIKQKLPLSEDNNRVMRLEKYFNRTKEYLESDVITYIKENFNFIGEQRGKTVISHGDLIAPNIMINNDQVIFVDWEFIAYRQESYDIAYFMLFSKESNCFDYIERLDIDNDFKIEVLKEGLVICLKEISNWSKLKGRVDKKLVDTKINRWAKELIIIIKKLEEGR